MEKIDVSYGPHLNNRHQVLAKYTSALKQLRCKAERLYDLPPFAFDNFVHFYNFEHARNHFRDMSLATSTDSSGLSNFSHLTFFKMELLNHILYRKRQILYCLFYVFLAVFCISLYRYESSSFVAERSVRSMVYPGIRLWRRLTLPLIERFPRLTELYDESCLMRNPFFQVDDISCSPCSHVKSVVDLTATFKIEDISNKTTNENAGVTNLIKRIFAEYSPFVFKISHDPIRLQDVYNLYLNNQEIFERDAYRVQSTNRDVTNLQDLFNQFNQSGKSEAHNLWRCNRLLPARLLRKIIARPVTLPSSLVLERYMAIDTSQAQSYSLPNTECPNVYIQQVLGTRFIILRPTGDCRHHCRTISIRLPQSYVLSYNSWYWKPISAPDSLSKSVSISLIGSYC